MSKCKCCHAPDHTNVIGVCDHCMDLIKQDVKTMRVRLREIYNRFPEDYPYMNSTVRKQLLDDTVQIYRVLERYQLMGYPVCTYVMPAQKIMHYLDDSDHKEISRKLFARYRRKKIAEVAFWATLFVTFGVLIGVLRYNDLTHNFSDDAVSVSASVPDAEDMPDLEAVTDSTGHTPIHRGDGTGSGGGGAVIVGGDAVAVAIPG